MASWQSLEGERRSFELSGDWQRGRKVRDSMADLANGLHRDPQLESILRNRSRELGIDVSMNRGGGGIGMSVLDYLGRSRSRGLSLERIRTWPSCQL